MREFICGYQTLLSCGSEALGAVVVLLVLLLWAALSISSWWDTRKALKRTPHPECCSTPRRCDGAKQCWMVPSCRRDVGDR